MAKPPVAYANVPYVRVEGSLIILDGYESYDSDGTIVSYELDLNNDDIFDESVATPTISNI